MDWDATLQQLYAILREHWLKAVVSLVFLLIGTWWGRRRARREWERRRFLDRLNFSLNSIRDGTLQIRTLAEMNCRDVFLNDYAVQQVQQAAERTTATNPLVPFEKSERWYILNALLNEMSERVAVGFLRRDMGLPTTSRAYLVCLTYENAGELRTRKLRAMVIAKQTLLELPPEPPTLERPHHLTRFETLRHLADAYRVDPSYFLEFDVCLAP